ncbi:MAG: dTMP kinase [Dehalococcoidia bacterium]
MGKFIVFEGGDGSGKSTQARSLYRMLVRRGVPALLTHEPGGTDTGQRIRRLVKGGREINPVSELLLFAASRGQLVGEVIRPALSRGVVVISDRYADSTRAYQGYGRGLDMATIEAINDMATGGLNPDLTILLDMGAEGGLARKGPAPSDRFEREEAGFHRRVREGYLKLARADPGRWLVLDATLPKRKVTEAIWEGVSKVLAEEAPREALAQA